MNSPGSQALEVAKNMKDLAVFKKPIGVAKKQKKVQPKILDEDTYIKKMAEIIQRDFFPHLDKLQAQNQYLDALEQNDVKRMRELYEKYSSGRPTTERPVSPATFETPMNKIESEDELFKSSKISKDIPVNVGTKEKDKEELTSGLDAYLSTHTSEDNASFEEMMIEAEKRLKLKFAWLYEVEENSKALMNDKSSDTLAIENDNKRPNQLDSWNYKNKNYIMYVPDGVELTPDERIDLAKRRQMVVHENTRLRINPFNEQQNKEAINELAKNQSKANDGKIGVDGKEIVRNPTPKINGFSFVATPSPRPGECDSPLMTWGQIEGTPFRLDGGDTPLLRTSQGPSFRMAEPPKREQLALQLAEKAGERHRDRKNKALEAARKSLATPSPRSTMDRLSTMSPAARRLATQKLRIASTPTPRRTSSLRTPLIGIRTPSTPQINTASKSENHLELKNNSTRCQGPVLTDNLLNLPLQRQRAADFFNKIFFRIYKAARMKNKTEQKILINMKSSVLNILFVLTIAYSAVRAQNPECTCGGLGQGSNPCTCSEVVVKAAKLPKPTYYVSPQEIKDAATVKNTADTSQTDCSNSQNANKATAYSDSNPSPCSKSSSNSNTCGCNGSSQNTHSNNNSCNCKKQNIETLNTEDPINSNGNIVPRFSPIGDLCYPLPMEPNSGKIIENTKVTPAYPGKLVCCPPSVPYEICINTMTGETNRKLITSSSDARLFRTHKTDSYGNMNFGTFSKPNSALYNLPLVYANLNTENRQKQFSKMISSSTSSDCFDDTIDETPEHNTYPIMPADAVSLTLAYKNLRAPNVIYRQGKQFVPEDKLSFGHRTVPADVKNENQILDIAEEKLVTVNKPVVELKLAPQKTVVIGSYNEQEEAKLAELEAIERESITQEETSDQMAESLITYKDLGYAPVDATYRKSMSYNQGMNRKIDNSEEEPCGPLGPSIPGYVPGRLIVQEKHLDDNLYNSRITELNRNIEFQNSKSDSCPK
ncbi:PREDICTED: uncharacterized protein LOC108548033 [Eufriesea mexicana]|uniref:uncharacterized protein LOC108548033 n=1 Tax=Eufriesea mexicana TaxID=516756 RepID=UPI00083C49EB|nr:PREDICTED: uncharacterized protein LOC108548033 [Eufriesea mexicana]